MAEQSRQNGAHQIVARPGCKEQTLAAVRDFEPADVVQATLRIVYNIDWMECCSAKGSEKKLLGCAINKAKHLTLSHSNVLLLLTCPTRGAVPNCQVLQGPVHQVFHAKPTTTTTTTTATTTAITTATTTARDRQ